MVKIPLPNNIKLEGSGTTDRDSLICVEISWGLTIVVWAHELVNELAMVNKVIVIIKLFADLKMFFISHLNLSLGVCKRTNAVFALLGILISPYFLS